MALGFGEVLGIIGVAGVFLSLALTMPATTRGEFRFLRVCLVFSGALIILSLFFVDWPPHMTLVAKTIINAIVGALVVGGVTYGLGWLETKEKAVRTPGVQEQDAAQIIASDFYAQITNNHLIISLSYENAGRFPARSIKIEMQVRVGEIGKTGRAVMVQQFPDDLGSTKRSDIVMRPDFPIEGLMAVKGKAFGVAVEGKIAFKRGAMETFEPFDYWILRKPDEDLSEKTKMVRRPDFLKR